MKNAHMLRRALSSPWAMDKYYLSVLLTRLLHFAQHDEPRPEEEEPGLELDDLVEGQVAVIPMHGVLLQHPGIYGGCCGPVVFTEWWGQAFDALVANPEVAAIVIDQDTPGGIVYGTPELSDKIYAARGSKPILSVSNALAASAGYWIGTAADQHFVTQSGEVGSIGVYTMHADMSKALEEMGVDISLIHAGEFKVEGNPFEPLSDEARAELQRYVDEAYDDFLAGVARNRGIDVSKVRDDFGKGRTVTAHRAVSLGMADAVATLDEVIAQAARLAGVAPVAALDGRSRPETALEARSLPELSASADDGEWPLVGAAVPYGRESSDMGGWREVFESGAFAGSMEGDIRVIWQHDSSRVLGRTKAGTARVWEEGGEVRYGANPPDAQWARDAMESIRRGDVDRSSFGFRVPKGGARWERRDGYDLRIVSKAELVELGPQTFAAYEDTSVAVREHQAFQERLLAHADADLRREIESMEMELGIG